MRVQNWPELLNEYIDISYHLKFEWGVNDCALWVGQYLEKVKVTNKCSLYLKKYKTDLGAKRILKKNGYDSLEQLMDDNFTRRKNINFSSRGDVVYYQEALGLCNGINSFFLTEKDGLIAIPTLSCDIAWRADVCRQ